MKVQSPVFGALSGKLGGTIASRTYGQNIVRSKPLHVYQPNSAAQQLNKQKMSVAGSSVKFLMFVMSVAFSSSKLKMPVISYIAGYFRRNGISGVLGAITRDFSKLAPASDSKNIASYFTAVKSVANKVTVSWDDADFAGIYSSNSEIYMTLIEDSESGLSKTDHKAALDGASYDFTFTGNNSAKTFFLYVYVLDPLLSNQSSSELALVTL